MTTWFPSQAGGTGVSKGSHTASGGGFCLDPLRRGGVYVVCPLLLRTTSTGLHPSFLLPCLAGSARLVYPRI